MTANLILNRPTGACLSAARLIGLIVAAVIGLSASASGQISYPNFSSTANLTLLQDAAQAGSVLRVTPAASGKAGEAWYNAKQTVANPFSTTFDFQIASQSTGFEGADGFAFVIQNQSLAATAFGGSSLGYDGIPNSLAVEFDTFGFFNNDPNNNHISVHTRGTLPNSADETYSLGNTGMGLAVNLSDGLVHTAKITYTPGSMSVFVDNLISPVLTVGVNLSSTLSLSSGQAYVGFTSGTGAGYENHDILNWTLAVPEPSSIVLCASASAALLLLGARRGRQISK